MKTVLSFMLDFEDQLILEKLSGEKKVSKAELIRQAVKKYITELKQEKVFDNEN